MLLVVKCGKSVIEEIEENKNIRQRQFSIAISEIIRCNGFRSETAVCCPLNETLVYVQSRRGRILFMIRRMQPME